MNTLSQMLISDTPVVRLDKNQSSPLKKAVGLIQNRPNWSLYHTLPQNKRNQDGLLVMLNIKAQLTLTQRTELSAKAETELDIFIAFSTAKW